MMELMEKTEEELSSSEKSLEAVSWWAAES